MNPNTILTRRERLSPSWKSWLGSTVAPWKPSRPSFTDIGQIPKYGSQSIFCTIMQHFLDIFIGLIGSNIKKIMVSIIFLAWLVAQNLNMFLMRGINSCQIFHSLVNCLQPWLPCRQEPVLGARSPFSCRFTNIIVLMSNRRSLHMNLRFFVDPITFSILKKIVDRNNQRLQRNCLNLDTIWFPRNMLSFSTESRANTRPNELSSLVNQN
mmetsp:Transcript_10353/g.15571  ORF Transcript_10353/g.15571 Transcript_10353/m.15571 type:complete len:210 (+) Transcript_10353:782-1411(+)